jgi:signal transduction histidine kinase
MPRNTAVFGPTFRGEGVVRLHDVRRDPRYGQNPPYHGMPAGHLPVVSYLAVPVRSHAGDVIGGLFFGHSAKGVFTERHARLVEGIAGWAALAMDNARLFDAQRRARAEAEAAREEAEAANRAKSDFLAAMSHDLRTPLNAIGGYAQLVEMGVHGPVTDPQRDALGRVRRAQEHLLTLINDILNFARIEAGHVDLVVRPVRLGEVLASVEPLVAPQLHAKAQRYHDDSASCDAVVLADAEKVRQVVLNLLSNAIKFTPERGTIAVRCSTEGDRACISVTDSGIGIPAPQLEAIFEPFVQIDRHFTSGHQGTGLGLAISRDLARRMGGDIAVRSAPGAGATFTLSLPLVDGGHRPNQ